MGIWEEDEGERKIVVEKYGMQIEARLKLVEEWRKDDKRIRVEEIPWCKVEVKPSANLVYTRSKDIPTSVRWRCNYLMACQGIGEDSHLSCALPSTMCMRHSIGGPWKESMIAFVLSCRMLN